MNAEQTQQLDQLRLAYIAAVDRWRAAIRDEEALAPANHTMVADEVWEQAGFKEEDARNTAKKAKDEYKDALRRVLYSF